VLLQVLYVGIAFQEPEQFEDNTLQVQFLRGQQGESVFQIIAALRAEYTDGTSTRAVALFSSFRQNTVQNVEILFHACLLLFILPAKIVQNERKTNMQMQIKAK
jgi:hypothetical protein